MIGVPCIVSATVTSPTSHLNRFLPVYLGAAGLAAITAIRAFIITAMALVTGRWSVVGGALLAIVVAAAGGAAGGFVYLYLGAPLRRVPIAGPYLAGIVTVAGYLGVILLLVERIQPDAGLSLRDPAGRFSFILCTLFFGIVCGHSWFRNATISGQ
jgi:hypothetical protein